MERVRIDGWIHATTILTFTLTCLDAYADSHALQPDDVTFFTTVLDYPVGRSFDICLRSNSRLRMVAGHFSEPTQRTGLEVWCHGQICAQHTASASTKDGDAPAAGMYDAYTQTGM